MWPEKRPSTFIWLKTSIWTKESDGSQKELIYETEDPEIIAKQPQETAVYFHIPVYAANPNVNAIVHTHSPSVATLTCMEQYKLQQVHQNSCRFFDKIAYDQDYNGLALSGALEGERLGKMLQGNEGKTRMSLTVPDLDLQSFWHHITGPSFAIILWPWHLMQLIFLNEH